MSLILDTLHFAHNGEAILTAFGKFRPWKLTTVLGRTLAGKHPNACDRWSPAY